MKNIFKMSSIDSTSSEEHLKTSNASAQNLCEHSQNAMSLAIKYFLKSLRFSLFQSTYPELCEQNPKQLKEVYNQLKSQLLDTFKNEEEALCNEVNLYSSISELEKLIENYEGSADKEAWRPSGNPNEDIRDHIHQLKLKHKKCLEFTLQTWTLQNESIVKTVEEKHQEIMNIKGSIDQVSKEIKKHFESLNDGNFKNLERQISSLLET